MIIISIIIIYMKVTDSMIGYNKEKEADGYE